VTTHEKESRNFVTVFVIAESSNNNTCTSCSTEETLSGCARNPTAKFAVMSDNGLVSIAMLSELVVATVVLFLVSFRVVF
jgi:hypothetical protein